MGATTARVLPPKIRVFALEVLVGISSILPAFTAVGSFYFIAETSMLLPPSVTKAFPAWAVGGAVFGIIVQFILSLALLTIFLTSPKLPHTRLRLGFVLGIAFGVWLFFFALN